MTCHTPGTRRPVPWETRPVRYKPKIPWFLSHCYSAAHINHTDHIVFWLGRSAYKFNTQFLTSSMTCFLALAYNAINSMHAAKITLRAFSSTSTPPVFFFSFRFVHSVRIRVKVRIVSKICRILLLSCILHRCRHVLKGMIGLISTSVSEVSSTACVQVLP